MLELERSKIFIAPCAGNYNPCGGAAEVNARPSAGHHRWKPSSLSLVRRRRRLPPDRRGRAVLECARGSAEITVKRRLATPHERLGGTGPDRGSGEIGPRVMGELLAFRNPIPTSGWNCCRPRRADQRASAQGRSRHLPGPYRPENVPDPYRRPAQALYAAKRYLDACPPHKFRITTESAGQGAANSPRPWLKAQLPDAPKITAGGQQLGRLQGRVLSVSASPYCGASSTTRTALVVSATSSQNYRWNVAWCGMTFHPTAH